MKRYIVNILIIVGMISCSKGVEEIDLAGVWRFAIDANDAGIGEKWYDKSLSDTLRLPGSMQEQGFGEDVSLTTQWTGNIVDSSFFKLPEYEPFRQTGNIKIPFWLQPNKYYAGVAWYQKEINIPASWKDRYVELELERTHWETTVYVNGTKVGKSNAMAVPVRIPLNSTGRVTLSLRVDNRVHIPVGVNSHSVSDHTQSNWNGVVGSIRLTSRPATHIDAVRVYPDIKAKKARIEVDILKKDPAEKVGLKLKVADPSQPSGKSILETSLRSESTTMTAEIELGDKMLLWSENEPNIYSLEVELKSDDGTDVKKINFGMREFRAQGTQFAVNGTPIFLRGTLECCIFPLTGYPAMDEAYWEKIYRRCKEFGLNHVRFHSWCPPEAAFNVADREGIYLQVECGSWANQGSSLGDGKPIDQWLYDESERIVNEYGNHPSFCMFLYGNEPAGKNMRQYLTAFVNHWKSKDSRRVYTSGAGWPYLPVSDFNSDYLKVRIQEWGAGLRSIINGQPPRTDYDWRAGIDGKNMPTVSHEIGQWCVYPNFNEIAKYTGVLKAKNFEIFRTTLQNHNLADMADKFLYASGRLQTLCYKADIEAALRTPGFGGFQLLDLHDFPGQGTALVGVLDPFWDTKGYVEGAEYSRFCNSVVPLARMPKLLYTNKDTVKASIEIANFSGKPLKNANVTVRGEIYKSGEAVTAYSKNHDIPVGNCIAVTDLSYPLTDIPAPSQIVVTVNVADRETGKTYSNSWNFWVYLAEESASTGSATGTFFTTDTKQAIAKAQAGGNVLLCIPKATLNPEKGGNIQVGFSSIFWNTAWTKGQAPHTLGIYCDPKHPALAAFPNDGYSDYQWWDVVTGSAAIIIDNMPKDLKPIVYHIDDWFTNRRLALLYEAKLGKGKIVVCGADLSSNLENRPAARQFRRSIEQYIASDRFNPAITIEPAALYQ